VFRGSTHGFTKDAFTSHILEPPLGPLVVLLKSESGRLMTGHTGVSISRTKPGRWIRSPHARLLSVTDQTCHDVYSNNCHVAVRHSTEKFILQFGIEDLCIAEHCNENYKSCSRLGMVYRPPYPFKFGDKECETYLAGSFQFKIEDIEIFEVVYE